MKFNSPNLSLADLLGKDYIDSVVKGNVAFGVMTKEEADALAYEKIDFYPEEMQKKNVEFARANTTTFRSVIVSAATSLSKTLIDSEFSILLTTTREAMSPVLSKEK